MHVLGGGTGSSFVVSGWLGVLLALIGGVGAAGFLAGYFDRSRLKNTIETYEKETSAQDARIKGLEGENTRQASELLECKAAIKVLTDTVTQAAKVELLASTSEAQHRAILAKLEALGLQIEKAMT